MIWRVGVSVRRVSLARDAACRVLLNTRSRRWSIQILSSPLRATKRVSSRGVLLVKGCVYSQIKDTSQRLQVDTRVRIEKARNSMIRASDKKESKVIPLWESTEPATSSYVPTLPPCYSFDPRLAFFPTLKLHGLLDYHKIQSSSFRILLNRYLLPL